MLLAIDTATEMLGLALFDGHRILWETERFAPMRHTVELAPAVEEMLRGANIKASEITALGVSLGPGSFTALRIGLSFAIGMALPRKLPVIGIPTLDILAAAYPPAENALVAVLRVGRGRIAMGSYRYGKAGWRAETEARAVSWQEFIEQIADGSIVCGEIDNAGLAALEKRKDVTIAPAFHNLRRAGVLAGLAQDRLRDSSAALPPLQPIYLNSLLATAG